MIYRMQGCTTKIEMGAKAEFYNVKNSAKVSVGVDVRGDLL